MACDVSQSRCPSRGTISRMVSPVSLRLRSAAVLREARATISRIYNEARLRRCTKFAALKALHAVREAFDYAEKLRRRSMTEIEQKHWRGRRKLIESELMR